jgi:hypothetical protein
MSYDSIKASLPEMVHSMTIFGRPAVILSQLSFDTMH